MLQCVGTLLGFSDVTSSVVSVVIEGTLIPFTYLGDDAKLAELSEPLLLVSFCLAEGDDGRRDEDIDPFVMLGSL